MTDFQRPRFIWRPSRRDLLLTAVGGFVAAVPLLRRPRLILVRRNVPVMGTIAEFAVAHREARLAHAAIDAAIGALRDVDDTMSVFKPSSDVGRANLRAARLPVRVRPETMTVLEESLEWAGQTGGAFDPCLGRSTELWDVTHRREPPPARDVERLANRRLYTSLDLGRFRGQPVVRFHDPDVQIDLGGIAKGFGVDRAVAVLREHGIDHALVGAGGDLYALGRSPSGDAWRVGVQSPDSPAEVAATLLLEDAAVATSGDYQQYFVHGSTRYHHLLDPVTGAPRRSAQRSVSVTAPTCMAADAAATIAFGRSGVAGVLARHGARVVHSM